MSLVFLRLLFEYCWHISFLLKILNIKPSYSKHWFTDDQAQTLTTPVIDLGSVTTVRGKESSRLYQIRTYGSNQMTVGLVHRDKCVTCKGHFSKTSCAHTTALRKSAIDDESDSETGVSMNWNIWLEGRREGVNITVNQICDCVSGGREDAHMTVRHKGGGNALMTDFLLPKPP